jgi:hypothetical protein
LLPKLGTAITTSSISDLRAAVDLVLVMTKPGRLLVVVKGQHALDPAGQLRCQGPGTSEARGQAAVMGARDAAGSVMAGSVLNQDYAT